jgi:hypothetical protein
VTSVDTHQLTDKETTMNTTANAQQLASAVYQAVTADVATYVTNPGGVTRIVMQNGYAFKVTDEDDGLTFWFEDQNGNFSGPHGYVELPGELVVTEAAKIAERLDELASQ